MTVEYSDAGWWVDDVVRELVVKHHGHLAGERIRCVFRDTAAKSGGKTLWGKARKISGLNAFLSTPDSEDPGDYFVIELALDIWGDLSDRERRALLDHELSHCGIRYADDGTASLCIVPHDVEEFVAVIARNGLWRRDVAEFATAVQGVMVFDKAGAA